MALISAQDVEQFYDLGYFLTDVVFSADQLQPMADEMDRVYAQHVEELIATGAPDQEVEAARGRRSFSQFHTHSAVAAEFLRAPIYLEACRKLIGAAADLYYNQATTKMPEGRGKIFGWHQDSGYTTTEPLEYITCWTAISDSDSGNGCIWVIPSSNKWGVQEHVRNDETPEQYAGKNAGFADDSGAIPVEMQAGQVAVFSSLMLHRSGANTSADRPRRGYVPQYHVPGAIHLDTGEPLGDQVPVLRAGERVG